MSASSLMLWELRGRSGNPLTCVLQPNPHGYRVIVTLGDTQLLTNNFGAEEHALKQGACLLRDFTLEGWTEVYRSEKIV